jgi:hypothetical protein
MPITLPPTVHERLARCAEQVFVDGLVAGAKVELHVDNMVLTATATGGGHTFSVPPRITVGGVALEADFEPGGRRVTGVLHSSSKDGHVIVDLGYARAQGEAGT